MRENSADFYYIGVTSDPQRHRRPVSRSARGDESQRGPKPEDFENKKSCGCAESVKGRKEGHGGLRRRHKYLGSVGLCTASLVSWRGTWSVAAQAHAPSAVQELGM